MDSIFYPVLSILANGTTGSTGDSSWSVTNFLNNATSQIQEWLGALIVLIGFVMVGFGVYQIAKGLISHGKQQTNWVIAILLLIMGGALVAGGFSLVMTIAEGGKQTIEDLGNSNGATIIPRLFW